MHQQMELIAPEDEEQRNPQNLRTSLLISMAQIRIQDRDSLRRESENYVSHRAGCL